jgi:hypothetical protein
LPDGGAGRVGRWLQLQGAGCSGGAVMVRVLLVGYEGIEFTVGRVEVAIV